MAKRRSKSSDDTLAEEVQTRSEAKARAANRAAKEEGAKKSELPPASADDERSDVTVGKDETTDIQGAKPEK